MGELILSFLLLLCAVPIGFWIAWLARDELIIGRRWFVLLGILGVLLIITTSILGQYSAAWTGAFISLLAGISYWKSFDKKWVKRPLA